MIKGVEKMVDAAILRKAQLKMVEILVEIDRICEKHDIKYWLGYGTLLGAVRHKGFIPWDDDCDICMMRADFEKFLRVASVELPHNMILQNKDLDPNYPKSMTKIRLANTKLVEFEESENEKYHQGIFVDVFIWDYYSPLIMKIWGKIKVVEKWKGSRKKYPKGSFKRMAIQLAVLLPYILYSTIDKILSITAISTRKNDALRFIGLEVKNSDVKFYDKDVIFPLQRGVGFEGKNFCIPNDYDKVLSQMYGDYMTLPKPEDRCWHARKIEV